LINQVDNPGSEEIIKKPDSRIGLAVVEDILEALHRDMDGFNAVAAEKKPDHIKQTGLTHSAPAGLIQSRRSEKSRDSRDPTRI
jgi:hypothetical protein